MVCKLQKSLYGLKQAPRQWYKKFNNFINSNGFLKFQANHCCYVDDSYIILLLYANDMLITKASIHETNKLKKKSEQFAIKDLGIVKQILGKRITRDRKVLKQSQEEYVKKVLSKFHMVRVKPMSIPLASHSRLSKDQPSSIEQDWVYMAKVPYAFGIGSLMYVMICARLDITHAVGVVSRYMSNPRKQHWEVVKWILKYLKDCRVNFVFQEVRFRLVGVCKC